jgi:hypothetical protein
MACRRIISEGAGGVAVATTFGGWLGEQMDKRGIRSGRRLALETGLDEQLLLDWQIGRRVPQPNDVDVLARFFGDRSPEPQRLRARAEQNLLARTRR